jgi:hypothetical protein
MCSSFATLQMETEKLPNSTLHPPAGAGVGVGRGKVTAPAAGERGRWLDLKQNPSRLVLSRVEPNKLPLHCATIP